MARLSPGVCALAALGIFTLAGQPSAAQPAADEELFLKNCQACHSLVADGVQRAGPDLQQILGRKVGTLAGFPYSQALKDADFSWTAEAMDAWLTNPQAYLPGTYMMYRQGDPEVRGAIIRYLQAAARTHKVQ
ncbi:MAG: c-type cytochrome [Kiloniellaceae bacterium]